MYEWLKSIEVGDEVILRGRLRKVDRVTTAWFVIGSTRVRRKDGRIVGAFQTYNMGSVRVYEATPAAREKLRTDDLRRWARFDAGDDLVKLSADQIAQAKARVERLADGSHAAVRAAAQAVLRQLSRPFPREEVDLDAVRMIARSVADS